MTVYQWLRLPAKKLVEIQERVQEQTRLQAQTLDKSQRALQLVQQAAVSRYQRIEEQNRQIQRTLDPVSRLQEGLREKALRIEQAHTEVEQLLQQLSAKVRTTELRSCLLASRGLKIFSRAGQGRPTNFSEMSVTPS